jgi:hypothetical protein
MNAQPLIPETGFSGCSASTLSSISRFRHALRRINCFVEVELRTNLCRSRATRAIGVFRQSPAIVWMKTNALFVLKSGTVIIGLLSLPAATAFGGVHLSPMNGGA